MFCYYQPSTGRPAYLRILGKQITWHEAGREVYDKLHYEVGSAVGTLNPRRRYVRFNTLVGEVWRG